MKMLGIKMEEHLEQIKTELFGIESQYTQIFHSAQASTTTSMDIDTTHEGPVVKKEGHYQFEFTGTITELSDKAKTFIEKIHQNMNKGGMLYRTLKPMGLFGISPVITLESVGLLTNEQKLAFIFQSIRDRRNSDRKDAFISETYVNVFDPTQALKFVQKVYTQSVLREAQSYKNQVLTQIQSKQYEQRAVQFACTSNLEEAAGCLYGVKHGASEFKQFYMQLMLPHAQLAAQKLGMMTHGEFQGVKLIMDESKNTGLVTWNPKNKVFNKIWLPNVNKTLKEDWLQAVPLRAEHIEHKYLRLAGVFVPYTKPRSNVKDPKHWLGKTKSSIITPSIKTKKSKKPRAHPSRKW